MDTLTIVMAFRQPGESIEDSTERLKALCGIFGAMPSEEATGDNGKSDLA